MARHPLVNAPECRFLKADRWLTPCVTGQPEGMRTWCSALVLVLTLTAIASADDATKLSSLDAIRGVREKVKACEDASEIGGGVKVQGTVAPDGTVAKVTADGSRDPKLNTCVADAVKTATFAKTAKGGTFSYDFGFLTKLEENGELGYGIYGSGLDKVSSLIWACKNATKIGGTVTANVTIDAQGTIRKLTVDGSEDAELNACMKKALEGASFKPTPRGGSFTRVFKIVSSEQLDPAFVERNVATIKPELDACAGATSAPFTLRGTVDPDGTLAVSANTQGGTLEATSCMYAILKRTTFEKTPHGGHFSYTFTVEPPKKKPVKKAAKPARKR
jgi:TonB family protein